MYFMIIIRSAILFFIGFAVNSSTAAENGYILVEIPSVKCTDKPIENSACSLGYKTVETSSIPNFPEQSWSVARAYFIGAVKIMTLISKEPCSTSGAKYLCEAAHPFHCDENTIYVDIKKLEGNCKKARSDCSSLNATLRDSFFNCSLFANNPSFEERLPRKLTCEAFPGLNNDPYSCEGNYKVFAGNATLLKQQKDVISFIHKMLKRYFNVTDAECQKEVAEVVCKATIPACSKDHTKIVSLLSKQDCYKTVGCVNKTKNADLIKGANGMCENLPDSGTAKRYSLDNVYDNKAGNHALAFSTILFIATIVAQLFY